MSNPVSAVRVRVVVGNHVETVTWESDEPLTVATALERAGITLNATQSVGVNGQPANLEDYLEDGDRVAAAGNKDSGAR